MNIQAFIDIVEDLNREISPADRYQRLLAVIAQEVGCEVVALLQLQGEVLLPLAVQGLSAEAMARRFELHHHPRLQQIVQTDQPVRFAADSELPDPYDGLLADSQQLHVHDCMGGAIRIGGQCWGVLTLDALNPGVFDRLGAVELRACLALATAAIRTSLHIAQLEAEAEHQHQVVQALISAEQPCELIGSSTAMGELTQEIETVAPSQLSVLVTGETGVGKELVARAIHQQSGRCSEAMVQVNCAALPENIIESELFGHVKGAFSGAHAERSGRFELADGGTLFLDEVGELPLSVQAKLLRALQSGEIQRVGSDRSISVDIRLIAATNRDLQKEVREGRFRADLYHRLSVYPLPVPPLRERKGDLLLLAGYFLELNQLRLGVQRLRLAPDAVAMLEAYHWPGNVRELEHLLSRAALKACRSEMAGARVVSLRAAHLGLETGEPHSGEIRSPEAMASVALESTGSLREQTDQYQRELISQRLQQAENNMAAAARSLGLDRSNLIRTMRRLGLK